ncbi:MAG: 4Fe-4S binding protein [Coriobacteriales bacterium]|nr:4Fe-4S binding protein [Coriobacteriales bacterium]
MSKDTQLDTSFMKKDTMATDNPDSAQATVASEAVSAVAGGEGDFQAAAASANTRAAHDASAWDISNFDHWKAKDFPLGAVVLQAGNSVLYKTGGWRSNRPVWNADNCTNCMLCWVHCPDSSILVSEQKMVGIDYDHCKGCGICVLECRFEALRLLSEAEAESQPAKGERAVAEHQRATTGQTAAKSQDVSASQTASVSQAASTRQAASSSDEGGR